MVVVAVVVNNPVTVAVVVAVNSLVMAAVGVDNSPVMAVVAVVVNSPVTVVVAAVVANSPVMAVAVNSRVTAHQTVANQAMAATVNRSIHRMAYLTTVTNNSAARRIPILHPAQQRVAAHRLWHEQRRLGRRHGGAATGSRLV